MLSRARPILWIVAGFSFVVGLACSGWQGGGESSAITGAHTATVQAADVHQGMLATASEDHTAALWTVPEMAGLRSLKHDAFVVAVAFAPDGARVATGSRDGTVRIWNTQTWEQVGRISREVLALDWAGNRLALAVAGQSGVELWDSETLRLQATLEGHSAEVFSVRFSADGSLVASGSKDETARIWDVASGEQRQTFAGHKGVVLSLALDPTSSRLASGASDKTSLLWDVATGEPLKQLSGHGDWVVGLDFRKGGDVLATAGRDGRIRLWDASSGANIASLDYDVGPFEDVRFVDGTTAIAVGEGIHLLDFAETLTDFEPGPPATPKVLDARCASLLQCGKALLDLGGTRAAKGGEVVRMAREIDVSSPEMCTTTLMAVPASMEEEAPASCSLQ